MSQTAVITPDTSSGDQPDDDRQDLTGTPTTDLSIDDSQSHLGEEVGHDIGGMVGAGLGVAAGQALGGGPEDPLSDILSGTLGYEGAELGSRIGAAIGAAVDDYVAHSQEPGDLLGDNGQAAPDQSAPEFTDSPSDEQSSSQPSEADGGTQDSPSSTLLVGGVSYNEASDDSQSRLGEEVGHDIGGMVGAGLGVAAGQALGGGPEDPLSDILSGTLGYEGAELGSRIGAAIGAAVDDYVAHSQEPGDPLGDDGQAAPDQSAPEFTDSPADEQSSSQPSEADGGTQDSPSSTLLVGGVSYNEASDDSQSRLGEEVGHDIGGMVGAGLGVAAGQALGGGPEDPLSDILSGTLGYEGAELGSRIGAAIGAAVDDYVAHSQEPGDPLGDDGQAAPDQSAPEFTDSPADEQSSSQPSEADGGTQDSPSSTLLVGGVSYNEASDDSQSRLGEEVGHDIGGMVGAGLGVAAGQALGGGPEDPLSDILSGTLGYEGAELGSRIGAAIGAAVDDYVAHSQEPGGPLGDDGQAAPDQSAPEFTDSPADEQSSSQPSEADGGTQDSPSSTLLVGGVSYNEASDGENAPTPEPAVEPSSSEETDPQSIAKNSSSSTPPGAGTAPLNNPIDGGAVTTDLSGGSFAAAPVSLDVTATILGAGAVEAASGAAPTLEQDSAAQSATADAATVASEPSAVADQAQAQPDAGGDGGFSGAGIQDASTLDSPSTTDSAAAAEPLGSAGSESTPVGTTFEAVDQPDLSDPAADPSLAGVPIEVVDPTDLADPMTDSAREAVGPASTDVTDNQIPASDTDTGNTAGPDSPDATADASGETVAPDATASDSDPGADAAPDAGGAGDVIDQNADTGEVMTQDGVSSDGPEGFGSNVTADAPEWNDVAAPPEWPDTGGQSDWPHDVSLIEDGTAPLPQEVPDPAVGTGADLSSSPDASVPTAEPGDVAPAADGGAAGDQVLPAAGTPAPPADSMYFDPASGGIVVTSVTGSVVSGGGTADASDPALAAASSFVDASIVTSPIVEDPVSGHVVSIDPTTGDGQSVDPSTLPADVTPQDSTSVDPVGPDHTDPNSGSYTPDVPADTGSGGDSGGGGDPTVSSPVDTAPPADTSVAYEPPPAPEPAAPPVDVAPPPSMSELFHY